MSAPLGRLWTSHYLEKVYRAVVLAASSSSFMIYVDWHGRYHTLLWIQHGKKRKCNFYLFSLCGFKYHFPFGDVKDKSIYIKHWAFLGPFFKTRIGKFQICTFHGYWIKKYWTYKKRCKDIANTSSNMSDHTHIAFDTEYWIQMPNQ